MNTQKKSTSALRRFRTCAALFATAAALAACGGSGDDETPAPSPAPAPAPAPAPNVDPALAMRGFWQGPITFGPENATRASAVVLPEGEAWIAYETATAVTGIARLTLTGTGVSTTTASVTGSGFYYSLSGLARMAETITGGSATGGATAGGTFTGTETIAGSGTGNFNFTAATTTSFTTAATAADVTGSWRAAAGNATSGAVTVDLTISGTGAVGGNSTTGCTYSGTITPRPSVAVYNVAVVENCQGTTTNFNGIATLASNRTSLRLVYVNGDASSGGLLQFTKQ